MKKGILKAAKAGMATLMGVASFTVLTGCDQSAISAELPNATQQSAQPAAQPDKTTKLPVRLSRNFLDASLKGSIQVSEGGSTVIDQRSGVAYAEGAPIGEAPGPDALADFRDREGCAVYEELNGSALCFNVMPDVSSVGLNEKDVSLKGMSEYVEGQLQKGKVQNLKFESADRNDDQAETRWTAQLENGSPLEITVRLEKL